MATTMPLRSDGYALVDLIKSTVVKIIIRAIEYIAPSVLKWMQVIYKVSERGAILCFSFLLCLWPSSMALIEWRKRRGHCLKDASEFCGLKQFPLLSGFHDAVTSWQQTPTQSVKGSFKFYVSAFPDYGNDFFPSFVPTYCTCSQRTARCFDLKSWVYYTQLYINNYFVLYINTVGVSQLGI